MAGLLQQYIDVADRLALTLDDTPVAQERIRIEFAYLDFPIVLSDALLCLLKNGRHVNRQLLGVAVFAGLISSGRLPLYHRGDFVSEDRFVKTGRDLGVSRPVAKVLYRSLLSHWLHELPRRRGETPIGRYLAMRRGGFADVKAVAGASVAHLVIQAGLTTTEAKRLQNVAIRESSGETLLSLALAGDKAEDHICCPPFADIRWNERFNYFGPDSRLNELIALLRENIAAAIRAIYALRIGASLRTAWDGYGLGDNTLNTLGARPVQALEDLYDKTTRDEVTEWLDNIRDQLAVIKDNLRVTKIWSEISTGDVAAFCGGDGDSVDLNLRNAAGNTLMDVAPFDAEFNYDDGGWAVTLFDGTLPQLEIPSAAADPLAVRSIRLRYSSGNRWYFDSAYVRFYYARNAYSGPLINGQGEGWGSWDTIHEDSEEGWVDDGDSFDSNVVYSSRLATTQRDVTNLETALAAVEDHITIAATTNFYVVNGDAIIDLLRRAALETRRGEHALARSLYQSALDMLADRASQSDMDRELVFAIHCLVADTYLAQGSAHFAYGQLREAWNYLNVGDSESRAYLWLHLAEVFLTWGDQLYAAAGSDYESRLLALPYYRKVYDECFHLTFTDGAEDEVVDLWLDLGRADGVVPAADQLAQWVAALTVHTTTSESAEALEVVILDSGDVLSIPLQTLPTVSAEIVGAGTTEAFVRVRLESREAELLRADLDFIIATTEQALGVWQPECARLQVRYARYNPLTVDVATSLYGANRDIAAFYRPLGAPLEADAARYWQLSLGAEASLYPALLCQPGGCMAELMRSRATVRRDQIRAHLNIYGIHDEYTPNGRFQSLNRIAQGLAERASHFADRYTEFLLRAEASVLEEMDASAMAELARENVTAAGLRADHAAIALEAAREGIVAAGFALQQSRVQLEQFEDTYQMGFLRALNNVSIGLPPSISVNYGGLVGSISGADGYGEQFTSQRMQYEAAVQQMEANVDAAAFQERLAEIESALAQQSLRIERLQQAHADERLRFIRTRTLTSTYWYETARIYRALAQSHILIAARWAWLAERALAFEINVSVDVTRMDYHLLQGGAARLLADLDRQRVKLAEFRERFRDIPNVIEREFRFSNDFPEQFRALTSSADAPPAERLGHGVRAVEFRTPMHAYDERLHGRYAFGRVLGVEIELQTDVSPGVFTGHLENARVLTVVDQQGESRRIQLSTSLVRIPEPSPVASEDDCPPNFGLDDRLPCPVGDADCQFPDGPLLDFNGIPWSEKLQWILDNLAPIRPRLVAADRRVFGNPRFRALNRSLVDRFASRYVQSPAATRWFVAKRDIRRTSLRLQTLIEGLKPVVQVMWQPYTHRPALQRVIEGPAPDQRARNLLERAANAGIHRSKVLFVARELTKTARMSRRDKAAYETELNGRQLHQLIVDASTILGEAFQLRPGDLAGFHSLRTVSVGPSASTLIRRVARRLRQQRNRTWSRYSLPFVNTSVRVSRDASQGMGTGRRGAFNTIPDYVDYTNTDMHYVLRVKHHDAESLSLSNFTRREDALVYNPYNPGDQLGVFENTGIDSYWRLTLRALPANPLNKNPQWDRIRDVVFRVWYHAAYERVEGFRLAEVVEPQAIRLAARKTLEVSFYQDFYDEFRSLVGDFDASDAASLSAIRSYTDESHPDTNGWISFDIDEILVPQPGQRIAAALLIMPAVEPSSFPNYSWQLRYGADGPTFAGNATGSTLADVAALMSRNPPNGFFGLDPVKTWHFRLAAVDNGGLSLAPITDIRLIFEFAPI